MLAIGFLSLLSMGFVAMAAGTMEGDGDDQDTQDQSQFGERDDDLPVQDIGAMLDDALDEAFDLYGVSEDDVDPETMARVNSFIAELEENPGDDPFGRLETFIAELEAEDQDSSGGAGTDGASQQEYDTTARNALVRSYVPIEEVDAETEALLSQFLDTLDPSEPIIDSADAFRDFVISQGIELIDITDASGAEDTAGQDAEDTAPPMGDEFRDPIVVAEQLAEEQRLAEIAAEIARQPENLVTVSGASGEVDDTTVLTDAANSEVTTGQAFVVTAPEGDHSIDVGYDAEHTFLIQFNDDTQSISASLNAEIEGPDGGPQMNTSTTVNDAGEYVTETTWSLDFERSTEIELNVTPDQIGAHVAEVDLINPADSLSFNFSADVQGNFHLITYEAEDGTEGETSAVTRAFVVQTADSQTSLSAAEVAAFAENGAMRGSTYNVLAEIYLGSDALIQVDGEEPVVHDFVNDNPLITTNITWASTASHAEQPGSGTSGTSGTTGTGGMTTVPSEDNNGSGTGDDEEDIGALFEQIGLNPGAFGF